MRVIVVFGCEKSSTWKLGWFRAKLSDLSQN